jgi:predicted MFS family arabinose efflux permease
MGSNTQVSDFIDKSSKDSRTMRLSKPIAFYLQASIILFFLAGSIAPTPLYVVYQAAWGFSPVTVTVIFGSYAFAVLGALLVAGSLSDYVGRRPVLLFSAGLQAVTMAVFATARGVEALLAARVLQGVATGVAAGAVGAGMLDLDRQKGTIANAVAPMLGTATGGLLSGLAVQYLPAPTELIYAVLGLIFIAQAIGVALMPESASAHPGALASLRPHLKVPPHIRRPLLLVTPALVGVWALVGFYGSLGPSLVRKLTGSNSLALGGLLVFVLAGSGALTVLLTHKETPEKVMTLGTLALFSGVALSLLAVANTSPALFFLGTAVAGAGFGAGFQGAIRTVMPLARPNERAGVLSVLWAISYLSMALPAVLGGLRVVHGGGLLVTAREYGFAVMTLAALGFLGRKANATPKAVPDRPAARDHRKSGLRLPALFRWPSVAGAQRKR